jgi:translation initiation factor 5B
MAFTIDIDDMIDDEPAPPPAPAPVPAAESAQDWESDSEPEAPPPATAEPAPAAEAPKPPPDPKPAESKPKAEGKPKKGKATPPPDANAALRSPICVIMGHVDTGKTKLLDKIRRSNVQANEAGGITQQIGATYFPVETLRNITRFFAQKYKLEYKLPGLLIIDTPGHESFSNLRSRGSSLCDIAILVVDIMHGIEKQTIESINLLRAKKTFFVIALNKIDQLSDWKPQPGANWQNTWPKQSKHAQDHFKTRLGIALKEFMEQSMNAKPYYELKLSQKLEYFPIVPTSAISGEGIPDLLMLCQYLTQTRMSENLAAKDELQCTVLEVKVEEGTGVTLDVILVNGSLHVNDTIVVAGLNGPIVTKIRALLTPEPLHELRVHSQYIHHDVIHAAMGCKVAAPNLDGAVAGSELFVANTEDEVDNCMERVTADVAKTLKQVDTSGEGVLVQASTLGSLEALICHMSRGDVNMKISQLAIGPVHKKDIMAIARMADRAPQYAVVLAFNVPVTPEARAAAAENKVTIFEAEIIYNLTDAYARFLADLKKRDVAAARAKVTWPAQVKVTDIFRRQKPMIIGVKVLVGHLKKGTPLQVAVDRGVLVGSVEGLKVNDADVDDAPAGSDASIALKGAAQTLTAGKDFKVDDILISRITRTDIDLLKQFFQDEMTNGDWSLIQQIKPILGVK